MLLISRCLLMWESSIRRGNYMVSSRCHPEQEPHPLQLTSGIPETASQSYLPPMTPCCHLWHPAISPGICPTGPSGLCIHVLLGMTPAALGILPAQTLLQFRVPSPLSPLVPALQGLTDSISLLAYAEIPNLKFQASGSDTEWLCCLAKSEFSLGKCKRASCSSVWDNRQTCTGFLRQSTRPDLHAEVLACMQRYLSWFCLHTL